MATVIAVLQAGIPIARIELAKHDLAALEHGESAEIMGVIKHALDPAGIMNPGKRLPANVASA